MPLKPLLPPVFDRKPRRLPERKPMTIAIGFRFNKGFLVCSDSMYTIGTMKTTGKKIFRATVGDERLVFGIAGSVPHGKMFIEKAVPRLATIPSTERTKKTMRVRLENALLHFYQKHMFPHPFFQREGGPDFSLIVGTWSPIDGLDCFVTSDTATTDINDWYPTGIGQDVARLAANAMFRHPNLSLSDALMVATYVLKETKDNVAFCGGPNQFAFLKEDGDMGSTYRLRYREAEEMAVTFSYGIEPYFLMRLIRLRPVRYCRIKSKV